MEYNYLENLKEDIKNYIKENDIKEINDELYDELLNEDSITGNYSGSYTFSTWQAEENLAHNFGLLKEACNTFGYDVDLENAEAMDVIIRCYLLGQALEEVKEEMEIK